MFENLSRQKEPSKSYYAIEVSGKKILVLVPCTKFTFSKPLFNFEIQDLCTVYICFVYNAINTIIVLLNLNVLKAKASDEFAWEIVSGNSKVQLVMVRDFSSPSICVFQCNLRLLRVSISGLSVDVSTDVIWNRARWNVGLVHTWNIYMK